MTNFSVNLSDKNALVTGAGEGVGWAVAVMLAQAGATVFANDLNPDRADKVADYINQQGGSAQSWQADISNKLLVGPMIEAMRDAVGKIDMVVNAAGVSKRSTLIKLDEWDWRRVLDVNLTGAFFVTQLTGRVMADEGGGVIVNIGGHALTRRDLAAYEASKAGLIGFTKAAAREFAAHNVRINAVCPANITNESEPDDLSRVPQGRLGTPEDVARVVLFLCSDAAAYIAGQAIHVDGGGSVV